MKKMHLVRFILPCLLLMFQPLKAKVEAPNYHFSINELNSFLPGKTIEPVSGQYLLLNKKGDIHLYKTEIRAERYLIPIFITLEKNKIIDFYAKLPSYFLHDVFFQSLINRFGKQDSYKMKDEHAVYRWDQKELLIHYSATCTITCFPLYLSIASQQHKDKSLLNQLKF